MPSTPKQASTEPRTATLDTEEALAHFSTLRDYLRWAVTEFNRAELTYGHGTDNAWDEAVTLVLATLKLPPDVDSEVLDAKLLPSEKKLLTEHIKKRVVDRIPVPYIVHEAWFAGFKFYVDQRTIIPRSPIAELLENQFNPWIEEEQVHHILDLCTGSGCIAIGAAAAFPNAIVDAVDISKDALAVAQINVDQFELSDNVHVIQSDLFEGLSNKKYELIISNPPYVGQHEYDQLEQEYHHEPKQALLADDNGLALVCRILAGAHKHLSSNGILVVEVGYSQPFLEEAFPEIPFTWLQFEREGEGVFLLTADELKECQHLFKQ